MFKLYKQLLHLLIKKFSVNKKNQKSQLQKDTFNGSKRMINLKAFDKLLLNVSAVFSIDLLMHDAGYFNVQNMIIYVLSFLTCRSGCGVSVSWRESSGQRFSRIQRLYICIWANRYS